MKRGIKAPFLILLCLLFIAWTAGLRINTSASAPRGIYRFSNAPVVSGDMASVCLPSDWSHWAMERGYIGLGACPDGSQPLVKRVVGLPGDAVDIDYEGIRVNGRLQRDSCARRLDSRGREMRSQLKTCFIPDGYALLLSNTPNGFDSRYFGLIPLSSIRHVVPVITF